MEENPQPKIDLVEIILLLPIIILLEIIGPFLPFVADVFSLALTGYFLMKGVPPARYLVAAIVEIIPIVDVLPLLTLGFFLTILADRYPKTLGKTVAVAGAVAGAGKGLQAAKEAGGGKLAQAKAGIKGASKGAREAKVKIGKAMARDRGEETPEEIQEKGTQEESPEEEARPEPRDFEREEVETFGMRPEYLSEYEREQLFIPKEIKDIQPPPK